MLYKFFRLSGPDRSLLLRSVMLVGFARVALWAVPFNVVRRFLTRHAGKNTAEIPTTKKIAWAISTAKDFVPRGNCVPQALAAESLLLRAGYPVELRIGVAKTPEGGLDAHAWVESGGQLVVGDLTQGLQHYTPLPPLPGANA